MDLLTVPRVGACYGGVETRTLSTTLRLPLGTHDGSSTLRTAVVCSSSTNANCYSLTHCQGFTHVYDVAMYADGDNSAGTDGDASCAQLFVDDQGDQQTVTQSYGKLSTSQLVAIA